MSVTPIRSDVDLCCPVPGVVVVAALLRCSACKTEWKGELDPFGAVVRDTARCPKCSPHQGPKTAA
jgi:hypothetical protein